MSEVPAFPFGFLVAEHDVRHQRVIEVSPQGKITHCYDCDDLPLDVDLRDDGHVLLTTRRAVIELNPQWKEVWRYTIDDVFVSAAQFLESAQVLVADTSRAQVYVLDRNHRVLRAIDVTRSADLDPPYHLFRNVRQQRTGRVLVACFHDRKVAEFDWTGELVWQALVEGTPYQALVLPHGNLLVSLGPAGRIVEIDRSGRVLRRYDMTEDHGLERGWIAGISFQPDGVVTYSDSKYDRLVAFDWSDWTLKGVFQDRQVLLHPSTHVILR